MSQVNIENILDKKLKKDYKVIVPYVLLDKRIDDIVDNIRKNYKMDGFRPGQVPVNLIKQKYQASIMAEESEKIINETSKKIVSDNDLRLALSPQINVKVFEPQKDFEYVVAMELFPKVPKIELGKIKITKINAKIGTQEIAKAIKEIVDNYKKWEEQDSSYKAKKGDTVNIDYVGKIDKKEFEGGSSKNHQLKLGINSFIDNFEDQLVGKKVGDEVKVKVKFPKEYHNQDYARKKAEFAVKINKILCAIDPKVDDQFVKKNFGLENIAKLEEVVKAQISSGYEAMSKGLFKKELFDLLNKKFNFDLPQGLIKEQFKKLWSEVEEELKNNLHKFKNEKEKEKFKAKKEKLSEKMIRNGIILSEIAKLNTIEITDGDVIKEVQKKVAQFPEQEKMITQYYQKNPNAVQDLQGMAMEEKVIDFIIKNANIIDKKVSAKDLEKEFNKKVTYTKPHL